MDDTPRTDAIATDHIGFYSCATVPADDMREMERELNDANAKLKKANEDLEQAKATIDVLKKTAYGD